VESAGDTEDPEERKTIALTVSEFAQKYGLGGLRTDPWIGDGLRGKIILGKYGFIDSYNKQSITLQAVFGFTPGLKFENTSLRLWNNAKKDLLAAGCILKQRGDFEGVFQFDPNDPKQVSAVVKRLGVRVKRKISTESLERLRERFHAMRSKRRVLSEIATEERGFPDTQALSAEIPALNPGLISSHSSVRENA